MEDTETELKHARPGTESHELPVAVAYPDPDATVEPYSVFTPRHRRVLTAVVGIASLASPLTANIYLPLLPALQAEYAVSSQSINLTLSAYVVVAAVMPAFFAPLADTYGRRPVCLLTYLIFSLGLALDKFSRTGYSYAVLISLRAVQALGASASASIVYGVVSDVCVPAERGAMVGPAISAGNVGVVLGPVLGGLVAWRSSGGVDWVFGVLSIFGVASLALVAALLPETARNVVGPGNGGKRQTLKGLKARPVLGPSLGIRKQDARQGPRENEGPNITDRRRLPNPLLCLSLVLSKDTALTLWLASCNYAVWFCVTASFPKIYAGIYGWNELDVGLSYLPSALSIMLAGFVAGPWTDVRYRRTACGAGLPEAGHSVDGFTIEQARIRGDLWPVFLGTHAGIAALGWAVAVYVRPAVLLCIQAATGFLQTSLFLVFNTLEVLPYCNRWWMLWGGAGISRYLHW
ncbi:major facilitator superfamily domain-containing protein [Xylariales sp. AK1849]|nr:major facilitator superfamily domain-containing protein [Xylariales sp. AK1849]